MAATDQGEGVTAAWVALVIVSAALAAFVSYWIGRRKSDAESWALRRENEVLRRQNHLLQQRLRGLKKDLEGFYPSNVWPPKSKGWKPDRHHE